MRGLTLLWILCQLVVVSVGYRLRTVHRCVRRSVDAARVECVPKGCDIGVCTDSNCRNRGSEATLATFKFLSPPTVVVEDCRCVGACKDGPNARITSTEGKTVYVSTIRSVDKVVDTLQTHLRITINQTAAQALKLNYEGNMYLRSGEVDHAIDCYDQALALGDKNQEGVLLVMRGTALLQRAYACKLRCKSIMDAVGAALGPMESMASDADTIAIFFSPKEALQHLLRALSSCQRLDNSSRWHEMRTLWPDAKEGPMPVAAEDLINKVDFLSSLYENALWRALQDLLTATVLLPSFAQAWRRAGDVLIELRKLQDAIAHYAVALRLDPSLSSALVPAIERLRVLDQLVHRADRHGLLRDAVLALLEE